MFRKSLYWIVALLVITALVGCGGATPTPTAVPATNTPEPTKAPAPATTAPVTASVYKIGTNAEYPPFELVDESGNITGFDADLIAAIAEKAGFEYELVNTRWDGIFVALQSGEFDAVISAATITAERAEIVNFSDPYFNAGQKIAIPAKAKGTINGPADLGGKKVGVQLGTTGDIWLSDNTQAQVVRYDEITLAFQALANGDVDAVFSDGPTCAAIIQENPQMNAILLDEPITDEFYGIAVNKDKADVLAAINAGLAAAKADGTYDAIYDKWFGTPENPLTTKIYKFGINAEFPPFEFIDETGTIAGFDVDLLKAIADLEGFQFEFYNTRWDGIFAALQMGEYDAVWSGATITAERAEIVDFSDPYFNAGQMFAVPAASMDQYTSVADFEGKKVGVQLGSTGDIWLSDNSKADVTRYDEVPLAMQAMANGDIVAVFADSPVLRELLRANPELGGAVWEDFVVDELFGVAVNRQAPELLAAINAGLAALKADGTYDAIFDKWFSMPDTAAAETYTIGTNAEYPPFELVDEAGNIVGFDIDLINAIAAKAGFNVEWVNTRWDGIFVALQSGEFDAVASAATITAERAEIVNFSDPYFNAGQKIAILKADADTIKGIADLDGKKVGVQLGTTGDMWLSDNTKAEVARYDEITLAFQALANGDVDAVFSDGPTCAAIIQENPQMNAVLLEQPLTDEFYGIAVNKDNADALAAINTGLAAIRADGTYDAIYDKWFGTN